MTKELRRYQIRVACHIGPHLAGRFDRVTVENLSCGEAELTSEPIDQSALHGVLERIRDLNIGLISVRGSDE